MMVLHGTWIPSETIKDRGKFFLRGESFSSSLIKHRGRPPKIRIHPFQAAEKSLFRILEFFDLKNQEEFLENCRYSGGFCDCEIFLNSEDYLREIYDK